MAAHRFTVALVVFGSLISGCVAFSEQVPTDQAQKSAVAYIFARLTLTRSDLTRKSDFLLPDSNAFRLGLSIDSDAGKTVILEFSDDHDQLCVVEVPPGTYTIKEIKIADAMGAEWRGNTFDQGLVGRLRHADNKPSFNVSDPDLTTPFQVSAGSAYYIGDYAGESVVRSFKRYQWFLRQVGNNEQTIADFKARYPNLNQISVVSPLQIPPISNPRTY